MPNPATTREQRLRKTKAQLIDEIDTLEYDITERKRAEQALRENQQLLDTILHHIPALVYLRDAEGRFKLVNRKYEEVQDVDNEKIRGKTLHEVYPKRSADEYARMDAEVLKHNQVQEGEERHWLGEEERTHAVVKFPIFNIAGDAVGVGGVDIDITDRKRTEKALAEKNRMLESLSSQLSKYLSPQVYSSIFAGKQSVEIESKRKKLTVFFSDIADFTGTTDSLESEELTNLLNHYLTEMSKIALDHGATIDKYVGDAIIAFFGDPETRGAKEDARACVTMAIAMQRRMRELRSEWLDMGLERPFELRIGINTGFCTVGNFGSAERMDYTIIGNEVNLAARLESHAEVSGILLSHETHSLVKDTVMAEEGDTLTVKGFAKPVRTYSVVGLYDDLLEQGRIIRRDQDGLALVIDRNKLTKKGKAEAIKALEEAVAQLKG